MQKIKLNISWRVLLAFGLASLVLDALSNPQTVLPLALAPWTPPPGLTLAFLLMYGLHYAPLLVVVTFLASMPIYGVPQDWLPALWAAGLLMFGLWGLAALLLKVWRIDPRLGSQRDLTLLLMVAVAAAWLDASVHVFSRSPEAAPDAWAWMADLVNFWVGALIRILIITPLVLVHAKVDWRGWRNWPIWDWSLVRSGVRSGWIGGWNLSREILLQGIAIAIALWIIFGFAYTDEFKFFYLLFLPMIWIAMRHGIRGATIALGASHVGINVILAWRGSHAITVVEFQMLMLGLAITMLFLGMTVTARRAAEERLHQREAELNQVMRLASAGEMAQAIAHELNQPLSAVANYARASRSMLDDPARHGALLAETLEKIDREANRAGQVMRRLREFFRGGGLRSEIFTLAGVINESLSYAKRRSERQNILFKLALDESLPRINADRVQMGTVLHNLLANAIEALASGPDPGEIEISTQRVADGMIQICVTDNGGGISKDMEGRLFESFATSKADGMGLGLAISRTLVQAHGGELWLAGTHPTRFCFTLPISGPKP